MPAAHLDAQEMISPITPSILTTVGIFLPLLMFKRELDIIGVLFNDLAFTIIKDYKDLFVLAGNTGGFSEGDTPNRGAFYVTLPPYRKQIDSHRDMLKKLRSHYGEFPGVNFNVEKRSFLGGGSPIDIILRSENLNKARSLAAEIKDLLEYQVDETIKPQISLSDGLPIAGLVLPAAAAISTFIAIHINLPLPYIPDHL